MSALEIFCALFAAVGVVTVVWLLLSALLTPCPGKDHTLVTLLPTQGDGDNLEPALRAALWQFHTSGLSHPLVVVDCGLNELGQERLRLLRTRWPGVEVCGVEEVVGVIDSSLSNL
jgi:hypothetical protein